MNKVLGLILLGLCLSFVMAESISDPTTFLVPVPVPTARKFPTLFDVWPAVDAELKTKFWYYLRGGSPYYEASIDSPLEYLFFTVYRSSVGVFLVSSTWDKSTQITKINSFVRLGNNYNSTANGHIYDPVLIDPFVVSIALGPNEFMVVVGPDGTVKVTGNLSLYEAEKNGQPNIDTFNVTADINKKAEIVDQYNRDQYWYYLNNSTLVASTSLATSDQYYFVLIYVNPIGTFLSISHWNLANKVSGVNTLVRLGDGVPAGQDIGPVNLSPSVLKLTTLN